MIDKKIQIEYWKNGSAEEIKVADLLFRNRKYRHGMFFYHLAIEKILKAHAAKVTGNIPPRTHNLFRLIEIAELKLRDDYLMFLEYFGVFQTEGRYPEQKKVPIDGRSARKDMKKAKEIFEWIKEQL